MLREKPTCYNGIIGTGCGGMPCLPVSKGLEKYLAERGRSLMFFLHRKKSKKQNLYYNPHPYNGFLKSLLRCPPLSL